jgi:CheY-like chemotaxis protein
VARILVADDQYSVQVWLEHILTRAGHSVEVAYTGREVLTHFQLDDTTDPVSDTDPVADFDLLITDITMPDLDGYHVLKRLRDQKNPIPIIVITVHRDESDVQEMKRLGARAVLNKPFSKYQLLEVLDSLLQDA